MPAVKIALGPLLYYWRRDEVLRFYRSVEALPLDVVYLGETVCSRRHELRFPDWLALAGALAAAGKEVVLSTQVLLESGSDVTAMQKVAENGRFSVEANDMGAVRRLAGVVPFVAGPHLNLYNLPSLHWMAGRGARRWVAPLEMKREDLATLHAGKPAGLETEVFAYGRMPLAFSARCFTARHYDLPKDDCRFRCIEHPDGLLLRTREQEGFLVLNGTQTQSAGTCNLLGDWDGLQAAGVDVVRLSPQAAHMDEVVKSFDAVRKGQAPARAAAADLARHLPGPACNGFWHGRPGMEYVA